MSTPLPQDPQRAVEHLVYEWARAIDEDRVEAVCELLSSTGRYSVQYRFNTDRGLPHALIDARTPAQLRDRIKSMRLANIYEPHYYRHIVSGIQIVGEANGVLEVRSNFLVVRTMASDGSMTIFATGQCQDLVRIDATGQARFEQRRFILDSRAVQTLLVIPL